MNVVREIDGPRVALRRRGVPNRRRRTERIQRIEERRFVLSAPAGPRGSFSRNGFEMSEADSERDQRQNADQQQFEAMTDDHS